MKQLLSAALVALVAFWLGRYTSHKPEAPSRTVEVTQEPDTSDQGPAITVRAPVEVVASAPAVQAAPTLFPKEYPYLNGALREERVLKQSEKNRLEYQAMLGDLGMSAQDVEDVLKRMDAVLDLSIIAGDSRMDLMDHRKAFDTTMREKLGEAEYKRFREYEESKNAQREMKSIGAFAKRRGMVLDPEAMSTIQQAIRESGAYTVVHNGGPYDPLPRPSTGAEGVFDLQVQMAAVESGYQKLLPVLSSALPEEQVELIRAYYDNHRRSTATMIGMLTAGPEARRQMLEERENAAAAETVRRTPRSDVDQGSRRRP